ncbi:hypothetical protein T4B_6384 [Trichinella pseudospiralis]|nr:hypothetical protein T4E_1372 [Trichinella pseudospiralis]KRY73372.1 hypothetical protein T4A_3137 [Trichinella pseudospiralis]KRZ21171.1 hypothetical protein T4B_6384 [Trichinella pseudospiralis]KRZ38803.1 hypothetical protein T4C_8245 [Trichinella pseudospiralis]
MLPLQDLETLHVPTVDEVLMVLFWLSVMAVCLLMVRFLWRHWEIARRQVELIQLVDEETFKMQQLERILQYQQLVDNEDFIGNPYIFYNPDSNVFTLELEFNNPTEEKCRILCWTVYRALDSIKHAYNSQQLY